MGVIVVRHIKKIHTLRYSTNNFTKTIWIKMMAMPKKIIGCIGKCTSGLSVKELDIITDHIQNTLNHSQGRRIFREFLHQGKRTDDLACLDFYEKICEYLESDANYIHSTTEPTLESLTVNVNETLDVAANLNGIPEIDMALLERLNEYLTTPCREAMLNVLVEVKQRLADHLANAHSHFRVHLLQPCPKTK